MTKTQIEYILTQFGESPNTWSSLHNITMIMMNQDIRIFVNPSTTLFFFDSEDQIIKVVTGVYQSNGVFITHRNETSNFTPNSYIPYSQVAGIISTSKLVHNTIQLR